MEEESIIKESINESLEKVRQKNKPLMDRIKKGKKWLVENRLEVLEYNKRGSLFDFRRWIDNLHKYWELYDEAFKKGLVDLNQHDLLHPEWIEDLMPMLKKIFPEKRFKEVL